MTTGSNSPAFTYNTPPDDLLSPIWTLRLFPPVVLIAIALSELVFKSGALHGGLIGFACGLLIPFCYICFGITSITMRKDQTRSDVEYLPITR